MTIKTLGLIVFSPTGSGLTIAKAIERHLKRDYTVWLYDITSPATRKNLAKPSSRIDYLLVICPVYADTIPELVRQYLAELALRPLPASVIVTYGNENPGQAAQDLQQILAEKSIIVTSAAQMVVAHSYNGELLQIAPQEPSDERLATMLQWVRQGLDKITACADLADCAITLPKGRRRIISHLPQQKSSQLIIMPPEVDETLCQKCFRCVNACPAGAIGDDMVIDESKCIRCLSCVKYCRGKARFLKPRSKVVLKMLQSGDGALKDNHYYL